MEPEANELPKGRMLGNFDTVVQVAMMGNFDTVIHVAMIGNSDTVVQYDFLDTIWVFTARGYNVTSRPGPPPHPGLDFAVARYCSLWAPTTPSRFCFWELTQELLSRSPILGMLSPELV
ncbi:hypothetical protein DVH24_039257 [Malus domestica]|uniref:Uncharacterized protein n=1 Tax=Malus domestica TaxID=3750 RepID=A0A498HVE1_MALDO|nr:hypothetical protein DVH24_039257 [Malus domestica]